MPKRHAIVKIAAAIVFAAAVAGAFIPWKSIAEREITDLLETQGVHNVRLTIASLGIGGIHLERIAVGKDTPLILNNLDISYSLSALWARRLNELIFTGLTVDLRQDKTGWHTSGIDSARDVNSVPFAVPVAAADIAALPFDTVKLKGSTLRIAAQNWSFDAPLQLEWHKSPASFSYAGANLRFKNQAAELNTGSLIVDLALQDGKSWGGRWKLDGLKVSGIADNLPPFAGNGTVSVFTDHVDVRGSLSDASRTRSAGFRLNYYLNDPDKSVLTVSEASFPWSGGTVALHDVSVPLATGKNITLNLEAQKLDLATVLQQVVGNSAGATGTISGSVPVTIAAGGAITIQQGDLHTEAPGTISLNPDAIPGNNDQVAIVRDILKNFHYEKLAIAADNGGGNKLSLQLTLAGNNPDMYGGKPVNLNVRLTGDVLNLLQQNILAFTNPQKLLEQNKNARP